MDNTILGQLCESGPWTVEELVRELGNDAGDSVGRLVGKGLAHRLEGGDFVIASAAGRHAHSWRDPGPGIRRQPPVPTWGVSIPSFRLTDSRNPLGSLVKWLWRSMRRAASARAFP